MKGFTSPCHKPMKVNEFLLSRYDKTSCYPSAEALLLEATPDILEAISPGLHIQHVQVFLKEIKSGSVLEDVIVKFFWGSQENLMQNVEEIRSDLHVDAVMKNRRLVAVIVLALILAGGAYVLLKNGAPSEQCAAIKANQNVIINIGAATSGLTDERFRSIIEAAVAGNFQIAKDAVKIVRPAKREDGASITMNDDPATGITSKAVKAMPSSTPDADGTDTIEDFRGVVIQIRATDLDSTKRGWAAVVPSIGSKRTKMHLDPHIRSADLLGKAEIVGDVTVLFRNDPETGRVPVLIFLRNVTKLAQTLQSKGTAKKRTTSSIRTALGRG